ncbi:MAG: peptide-methionine (R)-S-oxide reductase MsrB [Candidatus Paceibacterota bacterium]
MTGEKKSKEEWKKELPEKVYDIMFESGTERAGSSELNVEKRDGMFYCKACGAELFSSQDKFESGTGWPSFTKPATEASVGEKEDSAFFMKRTEVHCKSCGGHLGHVFPDGPKPRQTRYCVNGVALDFKPKE